jgi:hypothetical protein
MNPNTIGAQRRKNAYPRLSAEESRSAKRSKPDIVLRETISLSDWLEVGEHFRKLSDI